MRYSVLLLCFFMSTAALQGQQAALQTATEKLLQDPQLTHGSLGVAVLDISSGQLVNSINASKSFVPASLMKITTTATALAVLGNDFTFETQLCYTGEIKAGTLFGDIIIIGAGDPSLGGGRPDGALELDALIKRWADAIERAGIKKIEGNIIGDESLDPGAEPSPYWQWNDIGNYYGAGTGALIINENKFELQLQRTSNVGGKPKILGYSPDPGALRWKNELKSGASNSGDQSYIFGAPGTLDRVIRGTIPAGKGVYNVKGSLPDPAFHAADWLSEELENRGISFENATSAASSSKNNTTILDRCSSPQLTSLVKLTNFKSVNVFAEALYKQLGRKWDLSDNPAKLGEKLVEYWEDRGLDTDGWEQVDGSGLGMRNLITPLQLAQVLQLSGSDFRQNLPRVGMDGTVRGLLRGQPAAAKINAKSGTLKRSRGFCGYATTKDGRTLVFVIIANNFSGKGSSLRRKMATWMKALVE